MKGLTMQDLMKKAMFWIETVVAIILVALTVLAIVTLCKEVYYVLTHGFYLEGKAFSNVMVAVLDVFILVELFAIALAYVQHKNVIPTVLEAALVAVARKMVIFEYKGAILAYASSYSLMLFTIAITWFLLARSSVLLESVDTIKTAAKKLHGTSDLTDVIDDLASEVVDLTVHVDENDKPNLVNL